MFFKVINRRHLSTDQLRAEALMNAYYVIKKYPLHAPEVILDQYLQQQYKTPLKNMCIELLLNLTFCKDEDGNLVLLFKDPKYDKLSRLITYGNGAIPGSRILYLALNNS